MTNLASIYVPFDLDTGGGNEFILGVNIRMAASGGSAEAIGSQIAAASLPVVIASDQAPLDVSGAVVTVDLAGNNDVTTEFAGTTPGVTAMADADANPTVLPVGAYMMLFNSTTWDRAPGDLTDGMLVNLGANNEVTVAGTVTVDLAGNNDVTTEFATSTAVATMADDDINPDVLPVGAYLMGFDSGNTNWNRVEVDDAGHLQVDVLSGGGSDTPANPTIDTQTSANLAANASEDLTTAEVGAATLTGIDAWASTAWFGEIHTVDNAIESGRKGIIGADAMGAVQWRPPHRTYIQTTAQAGLDAFRLAVTNLNDTNSAFIHAVFYYEDV